MASSSIHKPDDSQVLVALTPPRIPGFSVVRLVSDGSVAAVYKARQDRLGRIVALKLLPELPAPPDTILDRFNRSAYVGAQVIHPNLPVLYETGTKNGYHYAVLEYIKGWTLQDLIGHRGQLSEFRSVTTALGMARALVALHEQNIIHRNIKPKNVMLRTDGQTYLIGTGLAKCPPVCFSEHPQPHTVGTPHYMAPEVVRGRSDDPRSDLYALGVTMYSMATGQPPFPKGAPAAVMAQHVYKQPPSVRQLRPDISYAYAKLVAQLLSKRLEQRPPSAKDVVRQLERLAERKLGDDGTYRIGVWERTRQCCENNGQGLRDAFGFALGLALMLLFGLSVIGVGYVFRPTSQERQAPRSPSIAIPTAPQLDPHHAKHAPAAPETMPLKILDPRMALALKRLEQQQPTFHRDPYLGKSEWNAFLRHFPEAPEPLQREARNQIQFYENRFCKENRLFPQGSAEPDDEF